VNKPLGEKQRGTVLFGEKQRGTVLFATSHLSISSVFHEICCGDLEHDRNERM